VPASRITRAWLDAAGVGETVGFVRYLVREGLVETSEWHHTGSRFRRTTYWRPDVLRQCLGSLEARGLLDGYRAQWSDPARRRDSAVRAARRREEGAVPAGQDLVDQVVRLLGARLTRPRRQAVRRLVGPRAWELLANPLTRRDAASALTTAQARGVLTAARRR